VSLGGCRRASQLARLRKLPTAPDMPEWIHKSHACAARSRPPNRNTAPWSMLLRAPPLPTGEGVRGVRTNAGPLPSTSPGTYCTATREAGGL
jgi:hypothetical protein